MQIAVPIWLFQPSPVALACLLWSCWHHLSFRPAQNVIRHTGVGSNSEVLEKACKCGNHWVRIIALTRPHRFFFWQPWYGTIRFQFCPYQKLVTLRRNFGLFFKAIVKHPFPVLFVILPGMSGEIAGLNEASKVSGPVSKHVYI